VPEINFRYRGVTLKTFARTEFFSIWPWANFSLGRLGCRRRSHLAPSAFGTGTFSRLNDLLSGFGRREAFMNPLSASDVFLAVAITSITFLTEVGLFILIGMIWKGRAIWATRSECEV
jgi:hypothetical protein